MWLTKRTSRTGPRPQPRGERAKPEPPGYFEGESMTRRRAFTIAAQGVGGIAGAAIVLPAVGFAVAPIFHRGKERWEAVGPVERLRRETPTARSSSPKPRGSATPARRPPTCARARSSSARTRSEIVAVSNRCAHLGCPVRFVEAAGNFICPCHGGVYDFQGKRIGGPPVRPLDHFQTRDPQRPGRARPPLQRHLAARAGARPRPRRVHRRRLGIPLPAPSVHLPAAERLR